MEEAEKIIQELIKFLLKNKSNSKRDKEKMVELKEEHKRINDQTGKPFKQGFVDQTGRIFYSYVNKIGNDGWYLEEWKKDQKAFDLKKEKEVEKSN